MKSNHFLQLIIFLAALWMSSPLQAAPIETTEARNWAEEKGKLLLTTFKEPDIALRYQQLDKLLLDYIDLDYISRFTMGKYWRSMSNTQQQRFRAVFQRYALALYKTFPLDFANKLNYEVTGVTQDKEFSDIAARVSFSLGAKQEPQTVGLQFRLHNTPRGIQLVDIKMEQSSLILAYRTRFYEMIAANEGDIEWFIEDLEDLAASAEANNQMKADYQN